MIFKTVLTTLFLTLCLGMDAQANESPKQTSIFELQPFERAVCCIKYYEGIHRKKDYPYVGYGHKLRAGEHYSSNMSLSNCLSEGWFQFIPTLGTLYSHVGNFVLATFMFW